MAGDLVAQIRGELTKELEFSGPLRGLIVCKYTVPEISSAMSRKTGWRVTRVALRPRNPALGSADAWEQKVLLDFERRAERGFGVFGDGISNCGHASHTGAGGIADKPGG